MKLTDDEREALVKYRIERSHEAWIETKEIISSRLWYAAANRMYYTCYYMTSALLIKYELSASTHSGVIRLLGMHFVTKGLISKDLGHFYGQLFELRQRGDYDDYIQITSADVLPLVEKVEEYMKTIEALIHREQ